MKDNTRGDKASSRRDKESSRGDRASDGRIVKQTGNGFDFDVDAPYKGLKCMDDLDKIRRARLRKQLR